MEMQPDHQHVSRRLNGPGNCISLLSSSPSTSTAIVFVHGFAGHQVKTWNQFHRLIDELAVDDPWWRDADLYFYGYNGVSESTNWNAELLLEFLHSVFPAPSAWNFRTSDAQPSVGNPNAVEVRVRTGPYAYKELILVGHSEGGVVIRLALLQLAQRLAEAVSSAGPSAAAQEQLLQDAKSEGWSDERLGAELRKNGGPPPSAPVPPVLAARLRLFAPAISGMRLTGFMGFLDSSFVGAAVRPFVKSLRAFHDLGPRSPVLETLKDDTNRYAARLSNATALKAHILWAKGDDVVTDQKFTLDKQAWADKKSHTAVCKPNPEYMLPVRFVEKGLP